MPLLEIEREWDSQPQYPVGIDRRTSAGRAITHCLPLNGDPREIVTGATLAYGSGGSIGVDHRGKNLSGSGSAACASIPIDLSSYAKLSVSFWLYWAAYAADDDLAMEFTSTTNTNKGFFIDPNYSGANNLHTAIGVGSTPTNSVKFENITPGQWNHICFTLDRSLGSSSAAHGMFINGVAKSVIAQVGAGVLTGNFDNSTLYLFSRNNASLFGAGRMQNLVLRGGYLMSAAEAKAEYDNPWQIFEPETDDIYFPSAGGGAAALDGNAAATASSSGQLTTAIPVAGAAASQATSSGVFTTAIPFEGNAAAGVNTAGDLFTQIKFDGAALAQALAQAGLSTGIPFDAAAAAQAGGSGELTIQINLLGAAVANALAQGTLSGGVSGFEGAAAAQALAAADLTTDIPIAGNVQAYANADGGLTTILPLNGVVAAVNNASGDLSVAIRFNAQALAQALASAEFTVQIRFNGAALAQAAASGTLAGTAPQPSLNPRYMVEIEPRLYVAEIAPRLYEVAM